MFVFSTIDYKNLLFDLISPAKCWVCGDRALRSKSLFCNNCLPKVFFIANHCKKCGRSSEKNDICSSCRTNQYFFDIARSVFIYDQFAKKIIHDYKFKNKRFYFRFLANLLSNKSQEFANEKIDIISCVPMHYFQLLRRGYNQSAILAKSIAKKMQINFEQNLLYKLRNNKPQHQILSMRERLQNLKDTFQINSKFNLKDKNILLIDDVLTTGTTANECAKILKKNGANRVFVLTVASTPMWKNTDF